MAVSAAESIAASVVAFLAAAMFVPYAMDWCGLPIVPSLSFVAAVAAAVATFTSVRPRTSRAASDRPVTFAFGTVVGALLAYLFLLSGRSLLPIGGGPDLAHHLALIDYIERHHRLVHDPALGAVLGEMVDYTPGAHLLAVVIGAWERSDGLHAVYPLVAVSVALKAGFVFLIALRVASDCVPGRRRDAGGTEDGRSRDAVGTEEGRTRDGGGTDTVALAVAAVLLACLPDEYSLRSFAQHSFLAQVISELFAVATWWAIVVWDEQPSTAGAVMIGVGGAATYLVWPVWVAPLALTFAAAVVLHRGLTPRARVTALALAFAPVTIVAAMHLTGRVHAAGIAATSGYVVWPSVAIFGWWFLALAAAGVVLAALDRRSRTVTLLFAAIVLQAAALAVIAYRSGADRPYLALKMAYLAIYPMAVAGAITLGRMGGIGWMGRTGMGAIGWAIVVVLAIMVGRSFASVRPTPVVSDSLFQAGRWAREHVDPACVDYLVADGYSGYWLHLAVLGNARMAPRTRERDTFEQKPTIERWVVPDGVPFAIADRFDALPRDIRDNVDVLARFGDAAVVKRRGRKICER